MAVGKLLPVNSRSPSLRGKIVVYTYRGRLCIRSWPRKRGKKLPDKVRSQVEWFKEAVQLAKYADPESQRRAIEWTKDTGMYPHDLIVHAMAGNLLEFTDEDGNLWTKAPLGLEAAVFQGARLVRSSTFAVSAGVWTSVPWQVPELQTVQLWSAGAPTRLTIPNDVSVVNVSMGIVSATNTTGEAGIRIYKNNVDIMSINECETLGSDSLCALSGPIPVVGGDYFEARVNYQLAHTIGVFGGTFFSIELLQVG